MYPFVRVMSDMSQPWPKIKDTVVKDDCNKLIVLQNGDRKLLKKVVEVYVELPSNPKTRRAEGLEKVRIRAGELLQELGKQLTDESRSTLMKDFHVSG